MENDNLSQVPGLIQDLIASLLPQNKENLSPYYLRLLSINITKKLSLNEESSLLIIQKDLSQLEKTRIVQLYTKLKTIKSLSFTSEILYLLSELKPNDSIIIPINHLELSENLNVTKENSLFDYTRDAIFAFQGINSRNFFYSEQTDTFTINSAVSFPIYQISTQLIELGWLYKKISLFVQKSTHNLSSVTMQSLGYSIKKKITEYYKFIATLDQSCDKTSLGMKKIMNVCEEDLQKLRWLAVVCDAVHGLKGGEILSVVFCYWRTGNQFVKSLMKAILEEVAQPILSMIKSWMVEGELFDTFHEFFIFSDYSVNKKMLWSVMFHVNPEMVPCFFSTKLTQKIFLTGKTLYFLRKECSEEDWSESIPVVDSILDIEKAKWVSVISKKTNEKLLNILFGKYKLQDHCTSVKKYLLMAQGDFHHALIEGIYSTLNLSATKIYKHSLISILETALKSSNCQYHEAEFTSRIKIILEDPKNKENGWDIFSLDYSIESPLSTFFSAEIMIKYRKIFNFLWKVKRAHFLMHSFQSPKDLILIQSMPDVKPYLKVLFMLGSQILHFINILSNYLMVETIEVAWEEFFSQLFKAKDLDELIFLHNNFVSNIENSCFFNLKSVFKQILRILEVIIQYHHSKETYLSSVKEEYFRRNYSKNSFDEEICRISKESLTDILNIANIFTDEVIKFSKLLEDNENLKLKNLFIILDFNEYYSKELMRSEGFQEENDQFRSYKDIIYELNAFARKYN